MEKYFQLSELLPELANGNGERYWRVPEWAFLPDTWTRAFLQGLSKMEAVGSFWEVGVGTGLVSFFLRQWFPQAKIHFSDYDARCTQLAVENLCSGRVLDSVFEPLHGSWNLLRHERMRAPKVQVVAACIPQVPAPPYFDFSNCDSLAHYYDPKQHQNAMNAYGLALNYDLLLQAEECMGSGVRVVLNLSGRPGLARLNKMFDTAGFVPVLLHEEVIPQHRETSLSTLASMEGGGHENFEFFADAEAQKPISATEAEDLRVWGEPLFHKIYVIEGTCA